MRQGPWRPSRREGEEVRGSRRLKRAPVRFIEELDRSLLEGQEFPAGTGRMRGAGLQKKSAPAGELERLVVGRLDETGDVERLGIRRGRGRVDGLALPRDRRLEIKLGIAQGKERR